MSTAGSGTGRSRGFAGVAAMAVAVGLFALMGFATTLALVLTRVPLGDAYALAIALTLAIQLASLHLITSRSPSPGRSP